MPRADARARRLPYLATSRQNVRLGGKAPLTRRELMPDKGPGSKGGGKKPKGGAKTAEKGGKKK